MRASIFILIIALSLSSISLSAQQKFLEYYKNINLAELAICDSNIAGASKYYAAAFAINPDKPFSKHLMNAFHAAMDNREYEVAEKYLSQLLKRGLGYNYINNQIIRYYSGESLTKLQSMLAKYPNDTAKKNAIVAKLDKMIEWDQGVRNYYSNLNNGAYMVDSTYKVDYTNAMELLRLFKEKGVLSEAVIGNSKIHDYEPTSPGYGLIILHHNGGKYGEMPSHLFDTLLYKAVVNLDFEANEFIYLLQRSALKNTFQYNDLVLQLPITIDGWYYQGKYYTEYFDEPSEKKINETRAKIGIGSLDDFRRKLELQNAIAAGNSALLKYSFSISMTVADIQSEESFKKWMETYGKDAKIKRSIFEVNEAQRKIDSFDIGVIGDWYIIGKTKYEDRMKWFKYILKELYQGEIPYANWKRRSPPLPFNYHAELIKNSKEDLATSKGRFNQAKFVPGYSFLIEHCTQNSFPYGIFRHVEELFDNTNTLVSLTGNIDTGYYKLMTRHFGTHASYKEKSDTVKCAIVNNLPVVLKTRTYSWEKGNNQADVTIMEELNDKCIKQYWGMFQMMDKVKYKTYLAKVEAEKKKLYKEFVAKGGKK